MQPSHYLQFATAALICDNVPLQLCAAAAAAACLINRYIGAESASVVVIKDGYGWNGLLSKSSWIFAHFVSEWILSARQLCWIFSCEASRSPEMLLNKPGTLAIVQIALFNGTDQWTDEMQLDCISETLMVALFDGSCFYYALELCQISASTHRSYSPLGSSYISMFKGARGGQLFMCFNDKWMNKGKIKLIPIVFDIWGCLWCTKSNLIKSGCILH